MKKIILILIMLAVLSSFVTAGTPEDLKESTVEYFKLEDLTGELGSNNTLINYNTSSNVPAKLDNGYDLEEGSSQLLYNATTTDFNLQEFTINLWIKPETLTANDKIVTNEHHAAATAYGWYFNTDNNGKLLAQTWNGVGYTLTASYGNNGDIVAGQWQMVTMTWDGSQIDMFVNGTEIAYSTHDLGAMNIGYHSENRFALGGSWWSGAWAADTFDGVIDEVSFFNKVLSQTEIDFLYNNFNPNTNQQYDFSSPTLTSIIDYPTNETTYYGNYNGSIAVTLTNVNGSATCVLNDSRWTLNTTTPLGNETILWSNNTIISGSNISLFYACNDSSGSWSNSSFWFYQETILDIYFYDENTLSLLNETITLDLISNSYTKNYTTSRNLSIYSLAAGDYEISYTSLGYDNRQYYITILEGQKHNISLYLINSTLSDQILAVLYDEFGNELNNYYIETYRRILGTYYNVETSKTNTDGETDFYAVLNTPMYYWTIKDLDGVLYQTTTETEIYGTNLDFAIVLGEPIDHIFSHLGDQAYTLTFDNSTNIWSYVFYDHSGQSTYNSLKVFKLFDGSLVAENGTTATSGTLTVDLSSIYENGTTYIAKAMVNASPEFEIDSKSYSYPMSSFRFGSLGLFLTVILLLLLTPVGYWNPAVMFVLQGLTMILTRIFEAHLLSYTSTTVIVLTLFIFAYIVSDRS